MLVEHLENINSSSDISQIAKNVTQLCLENKSYYFLNEIINKISTLFIKERLKCKTFHLILDKLEQFLIKKNENPEKIIKFCLYLQNNPIVQVILSSCYLLGKWVKKDEHKAFIYCQNSAEMGNAIGTCNVRYFYQYGIVVKKDEHKAFIYYQKAAEMGDIVGIILAGYCHWNGIVIGEDEHKAFIYY
ncbi:hypothetical protein C2G38_2017611 [Gigaspora rosea]|uniref:HCP-like protein n=1 Tax=Gigaspora rosea TaxID=44941 RepID=A0A397V4K5_9GLOM|nr:hypothetical protein C2G38_2017611 [Gigaspora rosea]